MTPISHLCLKSKTLKLPHLLDLTKDRQEVPIDAVDSFNTVYAYTEFHFPTVSDRIWWMKEFGVN